MRRDLFQFDLPDELIARQPAPQRQGSRLLYLDSASNELQHQQFPDLLHHIQPGDLMVFNNTKVIPARLFGEKETGGKIEVLVDGWSILIVFMRIFVPASRPNLAISFCLNRVTGQRCWAVLMICLF